MKLFPAHVTPGPHSFRSIKEELEEVPPRIAPLWAVIGASFFVGSVWTLIAVALLRVYFG